MNEPKKEPPPEDGWTEWGPVYDRQATVGVITALQSDGKQVRVVKEAHCNRVYVRPA